MSTGRALTTTIGALVGLIGLVGLLAGGALLVAHTQRDAQGFFTSPTFDVATSTHAITAEDASLGSHPGDWVPEAGELMLRITVRSQDDGPVFIGIADETDLDAYLDGVAHEQITRVGDTSEDIELTSRTGSAPGRAPTEEPFWTASATGPGEQTLTWDAEPGTWSLAVMNADGSEPVAVTASAGIRVAALLPVAIGIAVAGLLLALAGAALMVAGLRTGPPRASGQDRSVTLPRPTAADRSHPVLLEGRLDPRLSRGLWLVKWFLALPHVIVLAVLWPLFVLLTVAAGIAVLATGRYPRGIFDLNVGILRWTWRVSYYAFGAIGTDRYPPFSLEDDPGYPARLDVAYPPRLSRGLVLVKWWLLALPHYLIIGLFTGGLLTWTTDVGAPGGTQAVIGGGLIGILVLVAGVVLLFSGRYPPALFDLVVGLQRWVYRVAAYAALMTDEYPPFRLDTGGSEPGGDPSGPPDGNAPDAGERRELAHA